jgi:hypothetical protein
MTGMACPLPRLPQLVSGASATTPVECDGLGASDHLRRATGRGFWSGTSNSYVSNRLKDAAGKLGEKTTHYSSILLFY